MNLSTPNKIMNLFSKGRFHLKPRYEIFASSYGFCFQSLIASKPHVNDYAKPKCYQFRFINTDSNCHQKESCKKYQVLCKTPTRLFFRVVFSSSILQAQEKTWTVPNVLSLARIAATPFLAYSVINLDFYSATGILVGASVTDFIDGWIARSFKGQSSKLGSFLDPLADKLLVITLYGSMAYVHVIPDILMGLIVFRDVALLLAGVYIRYISIPAPRTMKKYFDHKHCTAQLSPTVLSKVNTGVQLITALLSLYGSATPNFPQEFLICAWFLAGFTTVTSGISYIFAKNTYKIMKN